MNLKLVNFVSCFQIIAFCLLLSCGRGKNSEGRQTAPQDTDMRSDPTNRSDPGNSQKPETKEDSDSDIGSIKPSTQEELFRRMGEQVLNFVKAKKHALSSYYRVRMWVEGVGNIFSDVEYEYAGPNDDRLKSRLMLECSVNQTKDDFVCVEFDDKDRVKRNFRWDQYPNIKADPL